MKIIILAGGCGTRLFPLSRSCFPKQFLKIAGQKSFFQQTVERFLNLVDIQDILVVTNEKYVFHVIEDLKGISAEKAHIITEPIGRNTGPAIALAMTYCKEVLKCKENEVVFVTPSDHFIQPIKTFLNLVKVSEKVCLSTGSIITMGIIPNRPETGYGYIQADKAKLEKAYRVKSFKEKPDLVTAEKYIADSNYYWNSGMFMFQLQTMEQAIKESAPNIINMYEKGFEYCSANFAEMPDISIDYAIAEKNKNMLVMPMTDIYWNDIGSFDAIADILADEDGNVFKGDIITEDCHNTMILGGNRLISAIDVNDLEVIDTPDVLLISKRGQSQKVKKIVDKLNSESRKEVVENVTMYRPWGSYTILAEGEGYKVKRITVNPGAKLSLQMHYHRNEHWTVIKGTGKLTLDDKFVIFKENESTYIPVAAKHRLENIGQIPLSVIEVQNGRYLGEDDIVRFDDIYGREGEIS